MVFIFHFRGTPNSIRGMSVIWCNDFEVIADIRNSLALFCNQRIVNEFRSKYMPDTEITALIYIGILFFQHKNT